MGVTALHLAALLPDGGAMAELLVLQCLPGERHVPGVPILLLRPVWC